jgi:hypothetical protein
MAVLIRRLFCWCARQTDSGIRKSTYGLKLSLALKLRRDGGRAHLGFGTVVQAKPLGCLGVRVACPTVTEWVQGPHRARYVTYVDQ